ncbi:MAG: sterol desaturase family protein [Acidimicrobiales bacterium]
MSGVALGVLTGAVIVIALIVRSRIAIGVVLLAVVFIPVERMFALRRQKVLRRGWKTDLVHFLVNGLALNVGLAVVVVVVVGSALRAAVPHGVRSTIGAEAGWAQVAEAFLLAELGGYFGHRAAHRVPLLWRFHKVHHSIEEMDWLAASHLHPLDQVFIRSCAVLPVFALGFGKATLGAYAALLTFQAIFIHSNVRFNFGPLRWLVATPQFHHWHHASEPTAYNSNFAGEFPVIDWMFGTLHLPRSAWPERYGVDTDQPVGYLSQLAWPFRRAGAGPVRAQARGYTAGGGPAGEGTAGGAGGRHRAIGLNEPAAWLPRRPV